MSNQGSCGHFESLYDSDVMQLIIRFRFGTFGYYTFVGAWQGHGGGGFYIVQEGDGRAMT